MNRIEAAILGVLGLGLVIVLAFMLAPTGKSPATFTQADYQQAKAAENPNDPCATPPGYTDASWREHMGHHPDQYKQCLSTP